MVDIHRIAAAASLGFLTLCSLPKDARAATITSSDGREVHGARLHLTDEENHALARTTVTYETLEIHTSTTKSHSSMNQRADLVTDDNGQAFMPISPKASYVTVLIHRKDFVNFRQVYKQPIGDDINITLRKPYTMVSGTVRDIHTSNPVANVEVTLNATKPDDEDKHASHILGYYTIARTDDEGRFETDRLPAGNAHLNISTRDGHRLMPVKRGRSYEFKVPEDKPLVLEDLFIYEGYTLTGFVLDSETSQPLAGATVGFPLPYDSSLKAVTTNAEGRYKLTGITPFCSPENEELRFPGLQAAMNGYESQTVNSTVEKFDLNNLLICHDFNLAKKH